MSEGSNLFLEVLLLSSFPPLMYFMITPKNMNHSYHEIMNYYQEFKEFTHNITNFSQEDIIKGNIKEMMKSPNSLNLVQRKENLK